MSILFQELYSYFGFAYVVLSLVFALFLGIIGNSSNNRIGNYRICCNLFALASLWVFGVGVLNILLPQTDPSCFTTKTLFLQLFSAAIVQNLVSLGLIAFLYPPKELFSRIKCRGAWVVFVFFVVPLFLFALFPYNSNAWLIVFACGYGIMGVMYGYRFVTLYRTRTRVFDDFYSEDERVGLLWIFPAFGVSLLFCIYMIVSRFLTVNAIYIIPILGIAYKSYLTLMLLGSRKVLLKMSVSEADSTEKEVATPPENEKIPLCEPVQVCVSNENPLYFEYIKEQIDDWIANNLFVVPDLSIVIVAEQLNTNRNYLSLYLNQKLNRTFRSWISELRIRYAQLIMKETPHLSLEEVAKTVGISNATNFSHQFKKIEGVSPMVWLKDELKMKSEK